MSAHLKITTHLSDEWIQQYPKERAEEGVGGMKLETSFLRELPARAAKRTQSHRS